jgi:uncharacterized BrkB/YihY/UPF0761 family membrane protein
MNSDFTTTIVSSYNKIKDITSLSIVVSYYIFYTIFPILIIGLIIIYILYSSSILAKDIRNSF